jgi:hypothetical protein
MSSRHRRNKGRHVDDTLRRISVLKKRQRREYHNITLFCKIVYLCHDTTNCILYHIIYYINMWLHVSTNYKVILRPLEHIKSKLQ